MVSLSSMASLSFMKTHCIMVTKLKIVKIPKKYHIKIIGDKVCIKADITIFNSVDLCGYMQQNSLSSMFINFSLNYIILHLSLMSTHGRKR